MVTISWAVVITIGLIYLVCSVVSTVKINKQIALKEGTIKEIESKYFEEYANREVLNGTSFINFLYDNHHDDYKRYDEARYMHIDEHFKFCESAICLRVFGIFLLCVTIIAHALSIVIIHEEYMASEKSYEYMQEYANTVSDDLLRIGGAEQLLDYNKQVVNNQLIQSIWLNKPIYIDDWNNLKLLSLKKGEE